MNGASLSYSVTALTLIALFRARKEQARGYREALAQPLGLESVKHMLTGTSAPMSMLEARRSPAWANVRLVNGESHECALPLGKLVDWARGADRLAVQIVADYMPASRYTGRPEQDQRVTAIRFTHATGSLVLYGHKIMAPAATNSRGFAISVPCRLIGEHLTLTAPADGGEFRLGSVIASNHTQTGPENAEQSLCVAPAFPAQP